MPQRYRGTWDQACAPHREPTEMRANDFKD